MNTKYSGIIVVLVIIAVALSTCSFDSFGEKWSPFEFKGNELYRYRVKWEDEGQESAIYSLRIEENAAGNYTVKYSTEVEVEPSQLSSDVAFGYWGSYGPSLQLMFFNPMYSMFFDQLELKVGEKMSFYGQGLIKVTGKEKVAGHVGYVCRLFNSEEEFVAEWVVDPELALPLRSMNSEQSGGEGEILILDYKRL
ncbi:hypothetical protein KGY71_03900 [Candidatus Bipolaricaulota bacterium]|nr:hypothetical protein [Candidatus Bipolaricaulota bacterium]